MSFQFHELQLVPLAFFALWCLKKFIDSDRFFELKVVIFTIILSFLVIGIVLRGVASFDNFNFDNCLPAESSGGERFSPDEM